MKEHFEGRAATHHDDRVELLEHLQLEQTNAELQANMEKYRLLVDSAPEGIWAVDRDWNTSFVNLSMANMLGYSPEEMVGRPLKSFMDKDRQRRLTGSSLIESRG